MRYFRIFPVIIFILGWYAVLAYAQPGPIEFTPEERAFIKEHPVIRLGVDPQFVPYEFIDSDGQYKGIAADYMKIVSQRTGIRMEVVPDLTWAEAYERGVEKKVDALPCIAKTRERERYYIFSEPYYSFQRVIIVKTSNDRVKGIEDLYNKRVALKDQSSHHSYLKQFPQIQISTYPTEEAALKAVADDRETCFVGNYANSSYIIKTNGYTNLRVIPINTEDKQSLYFACRNDWPLLQSIINKGLASITAEEKLAIDNKWIGIEETGNYEAILRIAGIVGAIILGIFFVSLYWIFKLRKEVEQRRRIEEALKSAKEEAEFANYIKSAFLARMSHEIRTPLNAITGMAYLLKKTDTNVTQRIYLDNIIQASRNMLRIINDILDFSKIEAGKMDIERISFNLDKILQQVINMVSLKVEEKGIVFEFHKDPRVPVNCWGDPIRLEQILLNVTNNAVKFTNAGSVSLNVALQAVDEDLYYLDFVVCDTGIGMDEDELEKLFKPFSQGDSSITRRFGGTGLGLSIVKSLLEIMGGEIRVKSTPGQGSTFSICLPLEIDREKENERKEKSASVYFDDIRVLVLDKGPTSSNLLREYLNSFNINAEFIDSEEKAAESLKTAAAQDCPFNLLLVDNDTPASGGIDFVRKVRDDPQITQPKVILMIPIMREDLFAGMDELGIDLGITKPVIASILYDGIIGIFSERIRSVHDQPEGVEEIAETVAADAYHILVVEDNKINQFIARSILEQAGFRVSISDNGKTGYEFFEEHKDELDLVIMDLHMPIMNGYEAAEIIKGLEPSMPIVAITADAITGVEGKCRQVGINHYISKPFDPEQFIATIWDILKHRPAGERPDREDAAQGSSPVGGRMILDENKGIQLMGNNRDLYNMVLAEFYEENLHFMKDLSERIEQGNYPEAAQLVHKLKGSTMNIGAGLPWTVMSELQKALEEGDTGRIAGLQVELAGVSDRLFREIAEKIGIDTDGD
ncbi:MAG: response regulator [Deltaproteobacteria bacterium]